MLELMKKEAVQKVENNFKTLKIIAYALVLTYIILSMVKIEALEKQVAQQQKDIHHSVEVSYDLYHALKGDK